MSYYSPLKTRWPNKCPTPSKRRTDGLSLRPSHRRSLKRTDKETHLFVGSFVSVRCVCQGRLSYEGNEPQAS